MSAPSDDMWRRLLADDEFWSALLNDEEFWQQTEAMSAAQTGAVLLTRLKNAASHDTREVLLIRAELLALVSALVSKVGLARAKEMLAERRQ